jgi:hypothetical protein
MEKACLSGVDREELQQWQRQGSSGHKCRSKPRGKEKYCQYCKRNTHETFDCFKLQNREEKKEKIHKSLKVNQVMMVMPLLLLLIVILMVMFSLLTLDKIDDECVPILPVHFIFALIEIVFPVMNLPIVEALF